MNEPLLKISNISKTFSIKQKGFFQKPKQLTALDNINLAINQGETLGLVGESGSGKSTLAKILVGLLKQDNGSFSFEEHNSETMRQSDWQAYRSKVTMVFQDPYSSLNPRMNVEQLLSEPLQIHKNKFQLNSSERKSLIKKILDAVGMAGTALSKFPHEFSGGQRQRIGIARALVLKPRLLILDEPISALDVSIQAQIVNLLLDLKTEYGLTYLFIAHDLDIVAHMADRVAVLYLGKIMESGNAADLFNSPAHPYTEGLLKSIPSLTSNIKFQPIPGEIPSPINPPSGCVFHPRCSSIAERCKTEQPSITSGVTRFSCHYPRTTESNLVENK